MGFHEKTLKELHELCVSPFEGSSSRSFIMQGLETVALEILAAKIEAKIWVDGSFMSVKLNPGDVDILVEVRGEFYDTASPKQVKILDDHDLNVYKEKLKVDSRSWKFYPDKDHPSYWDSQWQYSFWIKHFGYYRDDGRNLYDTKGMALLKIPGCEK